MNDDDLKRWQFQQLEKCQIENALNSIIETYGTIQGNEFPPLHSLLQFYEHQNPTSSRFEESAILMAIHAHGLQQQQQQQRQRQHASKSVPIFSDDDSSSSSSSNYYIQRSLCPTLNSIISNNNNRNHHNFVSNSVYGNNSNNNNDDNGDDDNNDYEIEMIENNVNNEMSNLMETAVSVAIQKQGLGLLETNR